MNVPLFRANIAMQLPHQGNCEGTKTDWYYESRTAAVIAESATEAREKLEQYGRKYRGGLSVLDIAQCSDDVAIFNEIGIAGGIRF